MTRRIRWLGDPTRFIRTDGGGYPTGDYVDGADAKKLQALLDEQKAYPVLTSQGNEKIEVGRNLPFNWSRDWEWEIGKRITTPRGVRPKEEPYRRQIGGRRHVLTAAENQGVCPRSIRVADTVDLTFVEWWKKHHPEIPYRKLSRDYHWNVPVIEVEDCDVEIVLLATIDHHGNQEFIDVTDEEAVLASDAVKPAQ